MSMCTCANGCDRHPMADPHVFPPCHCWCHDKIASFRASPVRASSVRAQRPTPTSHQGRWANTRERP